MKGDRNMKRFMKKMNEKKGFTLAELLIVVAIIAVLVAVAIPVFNTQLEKAREATDIANLRSAYSEAVTNAMGSADSKGTSASYKKQSKDSFDYADTTGSDASLAALLDSMPASFSISVDMSGDTTSVSYGTSTP